MADLVNLVITFLTEQWQVALAFAALLAILPLLLRRLLHRPPPAPTGGPPRIRAVVGQAAAPEPRDTAVLDDRKRMQSIASDLRADNEKLAARVQKLNNRIALLTPLMKELNSNVERGKMVPLVERVLDRIFNPARMVIYVSDEHIEEGTVLTLAYVRGLEGATEGSVLDPETGGGFLGLVARKRVPLSREDLRFESNLIRQKVLEQDGGDVRIEMAAPIVYHGRVLGLLGMSGWKEGTEDAHSMFGLIADLTALAFANYLQYRKIEALANSDPLTGLYNKGYFLDLCTAVLAEAKQRSEPASILMFDVDSFKHYNDTNGHLPGDKLLRRLGELLRAATKEKGTPARFGGEEFIVLLRGAPEEAVSLAEHIRSAVAEFPFEHRDLQPLGTISVSGGVASMPANGTTMAELIQAADDALYLAKRAGKNRVVVAGSPVSSSMAEV